MPGKFTRRRDRRACAAVAGAFVSLPVTSMTSMSAASMSAAAVPAASVAAMTTASVSTMTAAWSSATGMAARTPAGVSSASAACPAMPSRATAPAEAAAPCVTAPIEAGTTPAIIVPAVVLSAVEELSLFHVARYRSGREAIDGHSVGVAKRPQQGKRSRGGIDQWSHEHLLLFLFEGACLRRDWQRQASEGSEASTRKCAV
jgi:hypothetical protein